MEGRSEWHRDRMAPEPAQFQHQGFITRQGERGCKPLRGTAGVKHDIALARGSLRERKPNAKVLGEGFSVCDDINEGHLCARQRGAKPRHQGATDHSTFVTCGSCHNPNTWQTLMLTPVQGAGIGRESVCR